MVMQTTPVSAVIYTFYATDVDQGSNGAITYELISPVRITIHTYKSNKPLMCICRPMDRSLLVVLVE